MEGVVPSPAGSKSRLTELVWRYPGVILLAVAAILGLVVLPALATVLLGNDVLIDGRISLVSAVWLVVALALCVVCLVARSGLRRDLGEGMRQLIAGTQDADASTRHGTTGTPDTPALGAAIVRGIFDLAILLIVQGIARTPLVAVVAAYQPKPMVDGVFVVVVVVIALLMLFGLYRTSQPLTEYLVTVGLDRVVPTAGFAASELPEAAPTRTMTRTSASRGAARPGSEPTVAAGGQVPASEQPTVVAPATIAASSEATVAAIGAPDPSSLEATIAAPRALDSSAPTVLEPLSEEAPASDVGSTVVEVTSSSPAADEATVVAPVEPSGAEESSPTSLPPSGQSVAVPSPGAGADLTMAPDATLVGDQTIVAGQPGEEKTADEHADSKEGK